MVVVEHVVGRAITCVGRLVSGRGEELKQAQAREKVGNAVTFCAPRRVASRRALRLASDLHASRPAGWLLVKLTVWTYLMPLRIVSTNVTN